MAWALAKSSVSIWVVSQLWSPVLSLWSSSAIMALSTVAIKASASGSGGLSNMAMVCLSHPSTICWFSMVSPVVKNDLVTSSWEEAMAMGDCGRIGK